MHVFKWYILVHGYELVNAIPKIEKIFNLIPSSKVYIIIHGSVSNKDVLSLNVLNRKNNNKLFTCYYSGLLNRDAYKFCLNIMSSTVTALDYITLTDLVTLEKLLCLKDFPITNRIYIQSYEHKTTTLNNILQQLENSICRIKIGTPVNTVHKNVIAFPGNLIAGDNTLITIPKVYINQILYSAYTDGKKYLYQPLNVEGMSCSFTSFISVHDIILSIVYMAFPRLFSNIYTRIHYILQR